MDPLTFSEDVERRKRAMLPMAMSSLVSPGGTLSNSVQPGQALPMSMRQRLGKVYDELDKIEGQDVDTSALQAFARQQGQAGEQSMLNALAAQYAGENFQPVQAQFLKRAAAATEPMKIGGGMLTPAGEFIKDPFASRDARRGSLERQATTLGAMIDRQEKDERDRRDRLQQQDFMNQYRQDMLGVQRIAAGGADNNRRFTVEDRMADDYEQATKNDRTVISAFQNLRATPASAAGDISFIFQYMKMLDPGSVVREGEFATAQNAASVPDQIRNQYNRALSGERLNPDQRQQFLQAAGALADVAGRRVEQRRAEVRDKAQRRGVDERNIIGDDNGAAADPLGLRKGK
jgi:hypothetical protein